MSETNKSVGFEHPRLVAKKILAQSQGEGDGAVVRRSIGRPELRSLDPFLMLDEFSVSPPAGFPDHPHRGFETVTYMLQGGVTHQDFAGHKGTIHAGEVQDFLVRLSVSGVKKGRSFTSFHGGVKKGRSLYELPWRPVYYVIFWIESFVRCHVKCRRSGRDENGGGTSPPSSFWYNIRAERERGRGGGRWRRRGGVVG
ncbi:hypothetical protein RD792_015553 [Penstemon davidsonii]|uniref:Pirin N-terminal domain-containing protein n=1 Tax=Penstemon davidsonii TaxID=160366 RepID=A0ABR0CI17_9LAMI|nr:hypothetical protein RD792_015553 [Penstemon davidsonii]